MNRIKLGGMAGLALGFLDGISALLVPGAQGLMSFIIVGATVKGLATGFLVGLIAERIGGAAFIALAGCAIGGVLSLIAYLMAEAPGATVGEAGNGAMAAVPVASFLPIVVPGILVGLISGLIVSKWGR